MGKPKWFAAIVAVLVPHGVGDRVDQSDTLIDLAKRRHSGIGGDGPAVEIGLDSASAED